jgi:uncharacterized protein YndB with AHSA1/START domain
MGPIRAEIEVDVPREMAYALISDLARRPSFTDHFLSGFRLTRIESSGVGAGARFRAASPLRSVWMDTTIVEAEAPHLLVERGQGGRANRIPVHTVWELTGGQGALTAIRVSQWTEAKGLDRLLELLTGNSHWQERGWRRALRRLRDELESERVAAARIGVAGGNRYATGVP